MARFNDLPNEIVLGVWHHVLGPDDIASFALVSRQTFELGTSVLEEDRRLRSKYAIIKNNRGRDDWTLAHLLKDVLTNPHIAFYVRHLHIYSFCKSWENPYIEIDDTNAEGGLSYPEPCMNLFRNKIRRAHYVIPGDTDAWIQFLESGTQEQFLASLLNLLPELYTIKLEETVSETDVFTVVHRILKKSSSKSFPRWKDVYLSGISSDEDEGINLVKLFLLLPSVEKVTCYGFLEHGLRSWIPDCIIAPRSSLINELVFDSCGDITEGLCSLLEGTRMLKKFTYVLKEETINVSSLHSTLLQHCRYSLEYLKLAICECKRGTVSFTGTLGSLHLFGNLKELDLEFSVMVNPNTGRTFDIPNSLPISIEAINILGRSDETDQHSLFIRTLINAKRTGSLHLKRLSHQLYIQSEFWKAPNVVYTDLCQQCGWHDVIEESE